MKQHAPPSTRDMAALVRPSEAQLRWAQFHHKRRAAGVRSQMDRLHQVPVDPQDVPGALPEDGDSSSNSNSNSKSSSNASSTGSASSTPLRIRPQPRRRRRRHRRPKVSRGRRAMLRVSKRAWEQRRQGIAQHGYQGMLAAVMANGMSDDDEYNDEYDDDDDREYYDKDDEDEALNDIFMTRDYYSSSNSRHPQNTPTTATTTTTTNNNRGRRRRRRKKRGQDDTFKRFQTACHAMMMNLAAPPKQSIIIPTKIWTRSVDPAAALDENYLDPKGGIRRRRRSGAAHPPHHHGRMMMPMDRGASWRMHLPKGGGTSASRYNPYYHDPLQVLPPGSTAAMSSDDDDGVHSSSSKNTVLAMREPGQKKFNQLVALVQQRMIERAQIIPTDDDDPTRNVTGPAPKMRLRALETGEEEDGEHLQEDHDHDHYHRPQHSQSQSQPQPTTRRANYVPRMRLKDFMPEGEKDPEAYDEEYDYNDDYNDVYNEEEETSDTLQIPKMRLRAFDFSGKQQQQEPRRLSRAKEMARNMEASKHQDQDRRLSKTRQMAQSLEGDPQPPKMRLRTHLDFGDEVEDGDEKKVPEDPPRAKPHRMSERFAQAVEQPSPNHYNPRHFQVRPLPPGTSCARCTRPSLEGPKAQSAARESDFFEQVRQMNHTVAHGSARVTDFFGQLGHPTNTTTTTTTTDKEDATASNRMSDFFAQVRQTNTTNNANDHDPRRESEDNAQESHRVSDFFAHVRRNNIANDNNNNNNDGECQLCEECQVDDEAGGGADNRVSPLHQQAQGDAAYSNVSPWHAQDSHPMEWSSTPNSAPSRGVATPSRHGWKPSSDNDDARSDHSKESAISDLWNRGRSSFNAFASTLNAVSESKLQPAASNKNAGDKPNKISNVMTKRVGGFLQMLQANQEGEKEHEAETKGEPYHDANVASAHAAEQADSQEVARLQAAQLEYNDEDDHLAIATFRKQRESMSPDDSSSLSSYRVLPADIRDVIQRMNASPAKPEDSRRDVVLPDSDPGLSRPSAISPDRGTINQSYLASPRPSSSDFRRESAPDSSDPSSSGLPRPSAASPARSTISQSPTGNISPQKYKEVHDKMIQNSPLLGDFEHEQSIIDTDDTTSDASAAGMDPHMLASMMLSPDLLQQRLHQAIRAVEQKQWDQVNFLINANPWLAEMCELTTNQYLLHKLAFYGSSNPPAPAKLCEHLMDMFPAAVYKFDRDGNVPLHLAAASGHLKMIRMLGERFESGASIRNEDGMLPLHFTIASYGDLDGEATYGEDDSDDDYPSPLRVIKTVLKFFPKAVAIADNDGNLPIHVAVECLHGGIGIDVIYVILDEADRQLQDPYGARFCNKMNLEDLVGDDMSAATMITERETNSALMDGDVHCNMVKNEFGETPLMLAVKARKGWEMIEALVGGPGGRNAALFQDANRNNALHLLVSEYQDPAAAMSILKIAPETATMRNSEGMLPIEAACMQLMPEEVILAIALVDLPVDIDDKDGIKVREIKVREEHGGSWWYLACECDDHYVDIVEQIVSICTFQQVRELCFMKGGSRQHKGTVISRATPECHDVLTQALRFLGRYEFVGNSALFSDPAIGLEEFDALDFGGTPAYEEGRRVVLKCYSMQESFLKQTAIIRDFQLDTVFVEEVLTFGANEDGSSPEDAPQQYCMSIERPQLALDRVVDGMVKNGGYRHDPGLQKNYAAKICAVLRLIAKSLRHLHASGVVHGDLCMENCGKFAHAWKILGRLDVQRIGEPFDPARFHQSFPPEALQLDDQEGGICDSDYPPVSFKMSMVAETSLDMWAFGKLAYETLVGKPLVEFDTNKKPAEDVVSLLEVMEWDESNMKDVFTDLLDSGATESCADLITSCLFPRPEHRPKSMEAILSDPFWKDMRQYRERSKTRPRRRGDSASVYTESSKSIFTETSEITEAAEI
jgi:ankyrin repeat protein